MNELDVVKLKKEFHGLPIDTQGTIVMKYDDQYFEVEFFDDNENTIGVYTTPADVLQVI